MRGDTFLRMIFSRVRFILAVAFLFGLFISYGDVYAVNAEISTAEELLNSFQTDGEYKLVSDINLDSNTFVRANISLDLNGHTLDLTSSTLVLNNIQLTLMDSSPDSLGKITSAGSYTMLIGANTSGSKLILESGNIDCQGSACVRNFGDLVIDGGSITGENFVVYNEGTSFIVNGGAIVATEGNSVSNSAEGVNFTMNGGLVKTLGDEVAIRLSKPNTTFVMNGGAVEALYRNEEGTRGGNAIAVYKYTEVTVNDGTISAFGNTITGNGSIDGNSEGTAAIFNINGGMINSVIGAAIYAPQVEGTTNITGGTLSGKTGIEIRAGRLNVSGGTIIGSGEYEVTANTNGLTTRGAAVSVAQHTTAQPIVVDITGGVFTAPVVISDANPLDFDEATYNMVKLEVKGGEFYGDNLDDVINNVPRGYTEIDDTSGNNRIRVLPVNPAGYYLAASSSGSIDITGLNGTTATDYSEINVLTNCRSGYDVVMSATVNDNTLYRSSNSSSTNYIVPITANTPLGETPNTWGFLLADDTTFVPNTDSLFDPVPLLSSPTTLKSSSETASDSDIDDKFRLHYGANLGLELSAGDYQLINDSTDMPGSILYQVTASPTCTVLPIEIFFNQNLNGDGSEGTDQTLEDFPTSTDNTINVESPTRTTITLSDKTPVRDGYKFVEWNTEMDGSGTAYQPNETVVVGGDSESGELIGEHTFYAIWIIGCEGGHICYDGNGATAGTMDDQVGDRGSSVTLIASNFSRDGYGFAGWNTKSDGSGTNYGPQQNFAIPESGGTTLYANWIESAGVMQAWTGADDMEIGDVTALTDNRDGQVYAVSKLADGNVWFIENFRLVPYGASFSLVNTNNPTEDFIKNASGVSSANTMCRSDNKTCIDNILYNANNLSRELIPSPSNNDKFSAWYSYGVSYNWHTATAGNGTFSLIGDAAGDICPAGWHLPTGNNGEYVALSEAISGTTANDLKIRSYPVNYIRSGEFYDTAPYGRSEYGRFWTSTADTNQRSYRFGFNASTLTPNNTWSKWDGLSVRCMYDGNRIPSDVITVELGEHVTSVSIKGERYGDYEVTTTESTIILASGIQYAISAEFDDGYTIKKWSSTENGQLGSDAFIDTDYTISGPATLSISAGESTRTTYTLEYDTGLSSDSIASVSADGYHSTYNFQISSFRPSLFGYTFVGWSKTAGASVAEYEPGDIITIRNADPEIISAVSETLYAVYREDICDVGYICYYGNGADSGIMDNQPVISGSATMRLVSSNYARSGFGFAGWIDSQDGTPYGPNYTISTPNVTDSGLKLYAKWIASDGYFQDWNECSSMNIGDVIALTDNRDNNTYAVAKLADSNCWQTENSRLNPATANINSQNTNNPSESFIEEMGSSTSSNSLCTSSNQDCIDMVQYNLNSLDRELAQSYNGSGNNVAWYSYGGYYNWRTATAGRGTYVTSSGSVSGDICPFGWRLPTGGNTGDYANLNELIGGGTSNDAVWRTYPNNIVLSGEYKGNSRFNVHNQVRLWTSTASDENNAYRFGLNLGEVTAGAKPFNKWDGFAIRCIFMGN